MKNIPRIFVPTGLKTHAVLPLSRENAHYLIRVMKTNKCLVFGNGLEFFATLSADKKSFVVGQQTKHDDPSSDITLYFAPIKRLDDMLNMATQLGVKKFQPVITDKTVANHINWERMRKIVIEAAEQSNRNSVPEILPPIRFSDLDLSKIVFADERVAHNKTGLPKNYRNAKAVLVGPEGGFSEMEFKALDNAGAKGISLGKTILRAEVAAIIAIDRIK